AKIEALEGGNVQVRSDDSQAVRLQTFPQRGDFSSARRRGKAVEIEHVLQASLRNTRRDYNAPPPKSLMRSERTSDAPIRPNPCPLRRGEWLARRIGAHRNGNHASELRAAARASELRVGAAVSARLRGGDRRAVAGRAHHDPLPERLLSGRGGLGVVLPP